MKIKKTFLVIALLWCAFPNNAYAQTVTQTLNWDHLADTLAHVNGYTFALKINANPATQITPTCVANGSNVHCTNPITVVAGDVILLTATNAAGSASGTLTYNPGAIPTQPTTITVTVLIKVP
jgi:hypothetical protein